MAGQYYSEVAKITANYPKVRMFVVNAPYDADLVPGHLAPASSLRVPF